MKSAGDIETLAKRIAFEPNAAADERILSAAEAVLNVQPAMSRSFGMRLIRRQIMGASTTRLAIVAAALAWTGVPEKVKRFKTYVFRSRDSETAGPRPDGLEFTSEGTGTQYYSEVYGSFSENYRNDELFGRSYIRLRENEFVYICYPMKIYSRHALDEAEIRELQEVHPKQIVAKALKAEYTELGSAVVEGKSARGVELRDPTPLFREGQGVPPDDFVARFWIDAETELPARVELEMVLPGSSKRRTMICDEFQWGVPVEASLFEPDIPADFQLNEPQGPSRPRPDSTPKTPAAEAFAASTQAEPYLSDFDHLDLPDLSGATLLGVDTSAAQPRLRLRDHEDVWRAQDAFIAKWPRYEDLRDQLAQELQTQFGVEQMTVEELVGLGIALRERFWELRGCLSEISYPYGYAARLATAMAHDRAPDNLAVTDQYIESISTCEVAKTYDSDESAQIRNPIYAGLLTELRSQQFEQLRTQVDQGHVPTWKDHVRVHESAILLGSSRKDYEGALEVTRWMIAQAPTAGWTYCLDTQLRKMEEAYAAGERHGGILFLYDGPDEFPEGYRYARRLRSFQGPRARAQHLLPVHLRHLKNR